MKKVIKSTNFLYYVEVSEQNMIFE